MTLTEQILNTMKEMMVENEAAAPDHIAEAVIELINERDHSVARNSDQLYDAVHELASLLVIEAGKYA